METEKNLNRELHLILIGDKSKTTFSKDCCIFNPTPIIQPLLFKSPQTELIIKAQSKGIKPLVFFYTRDFGLNPTNQSQGLIPCGFIFSNNLNEVMENAIT